jgi:hypothetical protein
MTTSAIPAATTQLFEILEPLSSEDRQRVVSAVLTLLGEQAPGNLSNGKTTPHAHASTPGVATAEIPGYSTHAQRWIQKNGIEVETLEHFFHIEGAEGQVIELPASGKSARERTVATFLLQGIAALLATGEPTFQDEIARKRCEHFGCYDGPNHAKYVKRFGNMITGSKASGWRLTSPGLAAAAALLKNGIDAK